MFKKLHRKMMISNMSILVIFMLVVFTSLYVSTYLNITNRNEVELNNLKTVDISNGDTPLNPQIPQLPGDQAPPQNFEFSHNLSMIVVLENGVVEEFFTEFNLQEDFINSVVEATDLTGDKVTINGIVFNYNVEEMGTKTIISYIDITKDQELLQSQLVRYLIIFVLATLGTGLISQYLTKRNIKPIEESYEKQKEFVQNASHELKTPLTVINTNIDVLLSTKGFEDNKWLKYVKTEVKRMNKLTHDLLYLANNEEQDIIKSEFNASEQLERLLLGVEALAYEKGIKLEYNLEDNVSITFNKEQFIQVVLILIDNAIKYTEKDYLITVVLEKQSKYTVIKVRNTGEGIEEKNLERLFERFYKEDKSRVNKQNSYGLGLSIARAIMDNHKGLIDVSSVIGEYTEFEIKVK